MTQRQIVVNAVWWSGVMLGWGILDVLIPWWRDPTPIRAAVIELGHRWFILWAFVLWLWICSRSLR